MEKSSFTAQKNMRLSVHALELCDGLNYTALMKAFRKKDVKLNGKRISSDCTINVGDRVEIFFQPSNAIGYDEIYSDQNIIVVDKKSGFQSEEVFESLCKQRGEVYFIHRLDRNTSGIMIFATNPTAEKSLLDGFKQRTFTKKYIAQVYGEMSQKQEVLTAYLKKDSSESLVHISAVSKQGYAQIKTGYKVLETDGKTSVLEVELFTGKTHQIRAHLSFIGHFIIGDGKYGDNKINKEFGAKTQRLCSYKLTLKFGEGDALEYLNGKTFSTACPFYKFK